MSEATKRTTGTPCGRTRRQFLWEIGAGFTGAALAGLLGDDGFLGKQAYAADGVTPFTYKEEGGAATFDGAFALKRLQYNIGEGVWKDTNTVADEVQLRFHIVVASARAAARPAVKK